MILLDTCVIIWDALAPKKLSVDARKALEQASENNGLMICDISFWEISMLIQRGRLSIDASASQFLNLFLQSRDIRVQEITPEIAELSVGFGETINKDPADRIIAATSVIFQVPVVTSDVNLREANILNTIW